eukprot:GHRQ01013008.1.p1 GENE.GHRQ01013008.1~~GHRQ01013008.1.p1  ORF type:complete len:205 (+),score=31.64 GHRQ01013008.1:261-875(+)
MAPRYPMLLEVAPEIEASAQRPAASPVWTNPLSETSGPALPGVTTLFDSFRNSCERWPSSRCLGHRPVVDGIAQPYKFITYAQAQDQTTLIASAFKSLGLKRCDKICILGSNCPEWMLAMQACNRMSYVCVPLYETLGEDAIEYIIEHSEARMVVVAGKRLGRMAAALRQVDKLAGVAYWGEAAPADIRVSTRGRALAGQAELR